MYINKRVKEIKQIIVNTNKKRQQNLKIKNNKMIHKKQRFISTNGKIVYFPTNNRFTLGVAPLCSSGRAMGAERGRGTFSLDSSPGN